MNRPQTFVFRKKKHCAPHADPDSKAVDSPVFDSAQQQKSIEIPVDFL